MNFNVQNDTLNTAIRNASYFSWVFISHKCSTVITTYAHSLLPNTDSLQQG